MYTRRRAWILALAALVASACSDPAGPEGGDVSGVWSGSFSHPAYDGGALTLTLSDANGDVEGTYRLILSKRVGGRAQVEESGGRVSGSAHDGRWALLMQRSGGDVWLLEGSTGRSDANGQWSTEHGVRGSYSVSR